MKAVCAYELEINSLFLSNHSPSSKDNPNGLFYNLDFNNIRFGLEDPVF